MLALCPGWVPLLTVPPPQSLIEQVLRERGAGTPVLVEFPLSVLGDTPSDDPVVYVRALPVATATAIHFREQKALREHRARGYSNVHPHADLLHVSPELFSADTVIEDPIASPADVPLTDWQHIDRVRGAVNAAVAASDSGESLAVAASALGARRLPKPVEVPSWLTWTALAGRGAEASAESSDNQTADRLTFGAAYEVLGERDAAEAWSPSEILDAIVAAIIRRQPSATVGTIIERNLQRVRELIDVERAFEPFRSTGSNALVSAKALLLTLLRPDLSELLSWPTEETGADDLTRLAAAVLSGRLRGLARESVELRTLTLDDLTAEWAVRVANGESGSVGVVDFAADDAQTAVLVNGVQLVASHPLVPDPVELYGALASELKASARVQVSQQLGWPVVVRVRVPAGAEVDRSDEFITITSPDAVEVDTSVDEGTFAARLRGTSGTVRRDAVAALRLSQKRV